MLSVVQKCCLVLLVCSFGLVSARNRDRFRLVKKNVSSASADQETTSFLDYGCEALIVISNEAEEQVTLGCRSADDNAGTAKVDPGNSYLVSIRPLVDGSSEYWCTILYQQRWARFDAYSENKHQYLCPGRRVYRYSIRHDGIYADPHREEGTKIRSLNKGHNKFVLWQDYYVEEKSPDGYMMEGFVDGGMCSDLPDHFDNKASAITVCDHQCLLVYDNRRCSGPVQKMQAAAGCQVFPLEEALDKKLSALKGC